MTIPRRPEERDRFWSFAAVRPGHQTGIRQQRFVILAHDKRFIMTKRMSEAAISPPIRNVISVPASNLKIKTIDELSINTLNRT